jgi:transposase
LVATEQSTQLKRLIGMSTDATLSLPEDPELLRAVATQQQATIDALQQEMEQLKHYVAQLLRQRYGPRSEKLDPAQLTLFEASGETSQEEPQAAAARVETAVRAHTRRGGGRNEFPADLPRKRIEYQLPPEQLACPCCGQERTKFGEEVSEQLEFIPASNTPVSIARNK